MVFILCGFTPHKKFNSNPKEVVEVDFLHHFVRGEGKCDMILFKLFFFCYSEIITRSEILLVLKYYRIGILKIF